VPALIAALGIAPHFRSIGPLGGRIDAVSGVPGNAATFYAGGLGGLFRSTDAGTTWSSIFNDKPVSSIDAIAVAASHPATLYAGTGEANLRNDIAFGDGVWRSDDAGTTWTHAGLDATRFISSIAVDPKNPDRVFVAALGDAFRPSPDRGIYRTLDGGKTWQKVLFTDERTGASSIAIDPADPNVLLAGMWEGWRTPFHLNSGGPTDGLYESTDGGDHWTRLQGRGLPDGVTGRIAVAFAPSRPSRIYALIESSHGSLWRSDDAGKTWTMVNAARGINQRPFYFTSLTIDPQDPDRVYFMSVRMWQSTDGGLHVAQLKHTRGGDYHQLWIDPNDPSRMIAGCDDGAEVSNSRAATWRNAAIAVAQPYHVYADDRIPYTICAEDQDEGSACGPSDSLDAGGISPDAFFDAGGGESGWIVIDRDDSNLIYADSYDGAVTRFDRRTTQAREIPVWPLDPMGWPAAPLEYRFQWSAPLAMSPQHPHRLWMGGNRIFQTDDGGTTWHAISPDLTRDDKTRQQISGTPITPDNTSVEYYDVVFCIAGSPLRDGEIWAGTDDGRIWLTRNGGGSWSDVTPAPMNGVSDRQWLRVDYVAPSPFDPATAYAAADGHKWGDLHPYLYVTHDFGRSWSLISDGLDQGSYTRMIRPDPVRRGMLYAGTETGLWYSLDEGASWMRLQLGLPVAPVYDFIVQPRFDDLVVATHGRGIWILDGLGFLQEMTPQVRSEGVHVFAPRTAYRFYLAGNGSVSQFTGENPPFGATVDVWLASAPAGGKMTLQILDGSRVVRTIDVKRAAAGVNRVTWDLRYDALAAVPGIEPWRSDGLDGPLVLPGRYTVVARANGQTRSASVSVANDPRSRTPMPALREQLDFLLRVRGDIASATRAIARLDAASHGNGANAARADRLRRELYDPDATQEEDALRYPQRVYGRLITLSEVAGSADAAPTASEYEVLQLLESQLSPIVTAADALAARANGAGKKR